MTLSTIWDSAFEPLARQFLTNNRQEMDFPTFKRIVGEGPLGAEGLTVEDAFTLFKADPISIASAEDFFVFDGTLPSEKSFLAQSLQEIFMTMVSNPEIMAVLGYGPEHFRRIFDDIYTLRGVTNSRLPAPTLGAKAPAPVLLPPPQVGAGGSEASASSTSSYGQ